MINLLPYKEKKVLRQIRYMRILIVSLVAALLLLLIAGFLFFPTLFSVNNRFALAQQQIDNLQAKTNFFSDADLSLLETQTILIEKKLTVVAGNEPTLFVKIIQSVTPANVLVTRYAIGDTTAPVIQVFGTAKNRAALEQFVLALKNTPSIQSVDVDAFG